MNRREPTKEQVLKVDLLKPIDIVFLKERASLLGMCYGKDFDLSSKECGRCHDNEVCAILFKDTLKSKVKGTQKGKPKFLDLADFTDLDNMKDSIADSIKTRSKENNPMSLESLYFFIKDKSNMDDKKTLLLWIKRFFEDFNLKSVSINNTTKIVEA